MKKKHLISFYTLGIGITAAIPLISTSCKDKYYLEKFAEKITFKIKEHLKNKIFTEEEISKLTINDFNFDYTGNDNKTITEFLNVKVSYDKQYKRVRIDFVLKDKKTQKTIDWYYWHDDSIKVNSTSIPPKPQPDPSISEEEKNKIINELNQIKSNLTFDVNKTLLPSKVLKENINVKNLNENKATISILNLIANDSEGTLKIQYRIISKEQNSIVVDGEIIINDLQKSTVTPPNPNPSTTSKLKYDSSNNYYASLQGKNGKELFDAIFNLQSKYKSGIKGYNDLYDIYKSSFVDKYFENNGTVLDVYSENPNGTDPYEFHFGETDGGGGHPRPGSVANQEGWKYNREHIIPQSWFKKVNPTRNDAHFIWPTDKMVNQWRGNMPHYKVEGSAKISKNGTKISNDYCEPIDYFKGDFARAYFYFQATHKNAQDGRASEVFKTIYPYFTEKFLTCYREWAKNDQVDIIEVDRNNAIAKIYQGLRNPFIDYPELPDLIFGNSSNVFVNKGVAIGVEN